MLTYVLDRKSSEALYLQLYRHIRADIEAGTVKAGDRLPSKRALARHLGVSVITVEGAFDQLVAEGYVRSEPRRGFFACAIEGAPALDRREARVPAGVPVGLEGSSAPGPARFWADLSGAAAPEGIFPYGAWARTMRATLAAESEATLLAAGEAQGSVELRRAIADHLRGLRGMEVHPDQVVIGSGSQMLYSLGVQLLGRRRTFAVEDPGYPRLSSIYRSHEVDLACIGMDGWGPSVRDLAASGASVLHCMPSHQFPLGLTTAVGRRRELLAWAGEGGAEGRYIIEDDYDCEFRMAGRPVPSLQTLDGTGCVIYTNTFTKTLGPAFRIGYMVLPWALARRFRERLGFYRCSVGAIEQLTLARFMESGDFERHVNRQRTCFRRRQTALVRALGQVEGVRLRHVGAGLHFLLEADRVDDPSRWEEAVAAKAAEQGVGLAPLGRYFQGPRREGPGVFVIHFCALREGDEEAAAQVIARSLEAVRRRFRCG